MDTTDVESDIDDEIVSMQRSEYQLWIKEL